jgi:hypothetical protein
MAGALLPWREVVGQMLEYAANAERTEMRWRTFGS